ncbi:M48 family metalloprotease [Chitinophaga sp. SYP-B3965]|uniref:M48 family metallopeptidase n=1 Tax=Chitinophaga sp. SYP-B3965 TaxID=2663120 RepID=UPI0012997B59|nr:M48 family metallopeptidase [Chitinophaga sp. SYP-B3965]MRG47727.1 M48 family metalloprotease [Chitinophaga sp. SYP-B3965]
MQTYQGTYAYDSPDNVQPAAITATGKRIEIHLKDADGNPRTVFWYWYNVVPGKETYGGCTLHHTGLPQQTLHVSSNEFAAFALQKMKHTAPNNALAVMLGAGVCVIALIAIAWFWLLPFAAGRVANTLPIEYEVKFGEQSYNTLIKDFKVLPEQTEQANAFYKAMNISSAYPIQITVVEKAETNAFAIPGGHIVVFSGLLQQMQHPEELAALLAHEYSHVQLRHTTRSLVQSLGTYAMISMVFGDVTGLGAVIVENANTLKSLEYSRKLEKEADLNGLQLLQQRKINGEGYIWLFTTLKKGTGSGAATSEWLSSHPDLERRMEYVKSKLVGVAPIPVSAPMQIIWKQLKADY